MSDLTYFRVGVPNDMVADIMWNDEFEVSMEPVTLKARPETNYKRYFGTPEKAAAIADKLCDKLDTCDYCVLNDGSCPYKDGYEWLEWLESEAE